MKRLKRIWLYELVFLLALASLGLLAGSGGENVDFYLLALLVSLIISNALFLKSVFLRIKLEKSAQNWEEKLLRELEEQKKELPAERLYQEKLYGIIVEPQRKAQGWLSEAEKGLLLTQAQKIVKAERAFNLILEVYHKIPILNKLLQNIIVKTEGAAYTLIEKFDLVATETDKATKNAQRQLEALREKGSKEGEKDFEEVICTSRQAVTSYQKQISELISLNKDNGARLAHMGEWIGEIDKKVGSIIQLSNKNNMISINSSIMASRLGSEGSGFKVLVKEIQSLNKQMLEFTKDINQIMHQFKQYKATLEKEWTQETRAVIERIEANQDCADKILSALVQSHELSDFITKLFHEQSNSTMKVTGSLNQIMESLQFQDITRQQIENVIKFLREIQGSIEKEEEQLGELGFDLSGKAQMIKDRIRDDWWEKTTVQDEKQILKG